MAFVSWMVFVTFSSLSSFKGDDTPKFDIPHLDKAVHFTFYFVAAVLAVFFIREQSRGKFPFGKALRISVLGAIGFGIVIEVLQMTLTSDRQGDVLDAVANSLGALGGMAALKFLFSKVERLKWEI
ncbi:VanZ family protein [Pseudozobellia thermophila]|uniref:VanZ like family protein n=1 Tax=Pseudozobellia thermophila TaxID=192903 RepID=A0A1M6KK79_9FLAO|nr:VanZ family protein [Pseudozobellia thermophila]SHJ59372.1 VanZ like family protein [Pseudozobellia thermophila]